MSREEIEKFAEKFAEIVCPSSKEAVIRSLEFYCNQSKWQMIDEMRKKALKNHKKVEQLREKNNEETTDKTFVYCFDDILDLFKPN